MTEPSYAEASRTLLRERFFNAASDLLTSRSWSEITMAELAAAAGVSRQTLYNEFGSRAEFAHAFLLREADRLVDASEVAIAGNLDDPRRALATALQAFLEATADHPVLKAIASGEDDTGLLPMLTVQGHLLERTSERLTGLLLGAWPDLQRADAQVVAETLARLAISHAAMPDGRPSVAAGNVADMMGPYLEQLLEDVSLRSRPAA